jgi:hypothetical protein
MDNKKIRFNEGSEIIYVIVLPGQSQRGAKKFAPLITIYEPKIKYVVVIFGLFDFLPLKMDE